MRMRKLAKAGCLLLLATVLSLAAHGAISSSREAEATADETAAQLFGSVADVEKVYKNNTGVSEEYRPFTEAEWSDPSRVTDNATLLYKFKNSVNANDQTALRLKFGVTNVYGLNNATIQIGLLNSTPEGSGISSYVSAETGLAANEYALDSYGIRWEAAYSDWNSTLTNGEITITLALNEENSYVFKRNSYNADYNYMKSVDTVGIRIIYPDLKDSRGAFAPKFSVDLHSAEIVGGAGASEICGVKCDEIRQTSVTLYSGNSAEVKKTFAERTEVPFADHTEKVKAYGVSGAEQADALVLTNNFGTNTLSFVFSETADISRFRKPALKIRAYLEGAIVNATDYHLQVGVFSSEDALSEGQPYGDNLLDRYGVRIQKDGGREFVGAAEGWIEVVLPVLGDTSAQYAGFNVNNELRTFNGKKLDGFAFRAHSGNAAYKWAIYSIEIVDLGSYETGTGVTECTPKQTYSITAEATLELENAVYVNYYFRVVTGNSEVAKATEGGVYISYEAFEDGEAAGAQKLTAVLTEDTFKARTDGIAAKAIGDSMWAQMYAVIDGETVKSGVIEYSPKIYAMNKLNGRNVSDETKDLCLALLDYGAAAQSYFGYCIDVLANAEISVETRAAVESYRRTIYTEKQEYEKAKFSFDYSVEMSLTLEGAIALNCYVTAPNAEKVQIAVFSKEPTATEIANAERTELTAAGGKFGYISEKSFAAKEIGDEKYYVIYVTAENGETAVSPVIAYGGITYAMNKISDDTAGAAIRALSKALLDYGAAAQKYFNYNTGNFANRYI